MASPSPHQRWSPLHLRLHRHLLRHPSLLPAGAPLLLAVSGGQDSMALTGLLRDLQRLHQWTLHLWHGDHHWRPEASRQAQALAQWAQTQGLPIHRDQWATPVRREADARQWRYSCLIARAKQLGVAHVVTGHTASDRAETLLLHLARGSHRRGLASLRPSRPLAEGLQLARPLLVFSRADTGAIASRLGLPVWPDPSNSDPRFSRNRLRQEVMPVLEQLHPGASRRISALADRLAQEHAQQRQLLDLGLAQLLQPPTLYQPARLDRRQLQRLGAANQRLLLLHWLEQQGAPSIEAQPLESLLQRLPAAKGAGALQLSGGWRLCWDRASLWLES